MPDFSQFKVRVYSPDGVKTPPLDYLQDLHETNQNLAQEAIDDLILLPQKMTLFQDIKPFTHGKYRFYELRVKFKNDICRFFFLVEHPNFIVIFGFTKKTQKTEKKDIEKGVKYLKDYLDKKISLPL